MKKKLLIAFCTFAILGVSTPTYAGGVTGVEVQKDDSEKYGVIGDFDYDIEGNSVKLHGYDGKCKILEILPSYNIDGSREWDPGASEVPAALEKPCGNGKT